MESAVFGASRCLNYLITLVCLACWFSDLLDLVLWPENEFFSPLIPLSAHWHNVSRLKLNPWYLAYLHTLATLVIID